MSTRTRARQVALQVLFQSDLNPDADEQRAQFIRTRLHRKSALIEFAKSLIHGVVENREALDNAIQGAANNWSVPRMAVTDRNILRLAAFEMLHTETPPPVVIDEAIELAKRFGSNQSSGFVNGILDRVLKASRGENDCSDGQSENVESATGSEPEPAVETKTTVPESE